MFGEGETAMHIHTGVHVFPIDYAYTHTTYVLIFPSSTNTPGIESIVYTYAYRV